MARKSKLYPINWEKSAVKEHELKKYKIYAHIENVEPFRKYIGKTGSSLAHRFGLNDYSSRFGEYLKEHPLTEMEHVVLATTDDPKEAKRLEEHFTIMYNTTDPSCGFNSQLGDKCVPSEKALEKAHEATRKSWAEGGIHREASKRNWAEGGALRQASERNWSEGGSLREALCKYWYTFRHPDGKETVTDNMREFCREQGICRRAMLKYGHTKGYVLINQEPKQRESK